MASQESSSTTSFSATILYAVCLLLGLLIGYLVRGNPPHVTQADAGMATSTQPAGPQGKMLAQMPTMDQMKHMADKQAEPLLAKLQKDPQNAALLLQIGRVYESAHQFQEAVSYFDKSLAIDPKNTDAISAKASCLFYSGDADDAIKVLNTALEYSPTDPRVLFNLGIMNWRGKGDAKTAVSLWQKLLKTNPKLDAPHKAQVEAMIKQANSHTGMQTVKD